jgi:uncharacterized protein DUF4397
MTQRLFRLMVACALAVCAAAFGLAGSAPATAAPAQFAVIRAAHFSPDTPGVDVYLQPFSGGSLSLIVPNASYAGVSPYRLVEPGIYLVTMRPHGAAPTTAALLSWTLDAKAGQAYTIAGVGTGNARHGVVLHDELAQPPAGTGRVRVVQAASRAPKAVVVAVNGPTLAANQPFATTTGYTQVPAGTWPLKASSAQNPSLTTSSSVSIQSGSVTSVLLLDGKSGGLAIRTVLDAASAPIPPTGAVPAGGGGMASVIAGHSNRPGSDLTRSLTGLAAMAAVGAAAGWIALARRRRRVD